MPLEHDNDNPFSNTILSAKIDAQLEVYGKITTDYTNIINYLEQVKSDIEAFKGEYHEGSNTIIEDLHKITNSIKFHTEDGIKTMNDIRDALVNQSEDVSSISTNLEIYQKTLETGLENFISDVYKYNKENEEEIDTSVATFKEMISELTDSLIDKIKEENKLTTTNNTEMQETVKTLHKELVQKKNKIRLKFYYIIATLAVVIATLETFAQLGIISIHWFAK